jgi:hypothetical protein
MSCLRFQNLFRANAGFLTVVQFRVMCPSKGGVDATHGNV